MATKSVDWAKAIQPLVKKYKGKKHPLNYENIYQLIVMVVLSAQSTDNIINSIAPDLFTAFPDMHSLSKATPEKLLPFVKKVIGHKKKIDWLLKTAQEIKEDANIPLTLEALVKFPGIGRKSANVILREAKQPSEGVIVDLHVVRVAERIGITKSTDPKKIEQDLMAALPQKEWGEVGMALSFLGREICRPSHPEHDLCPMQPVCAYYQSNEGEKKTTTPKKKSKGRW